MRYLILPSIVAFAATFMLLLIVLNTPLGKWLLDRPNERSLHQQPVPRIGGLAILLGMAMAWLVTRNGPALSTLAFIAPLIVISVIDDFKSVKPLWRLLMQLAVGLGVMLNLGPNAWPWAAYVGAVIVLVWGANIYNFMDGSDGLAGGMAVFGFGAYAWVAGGAGNMEFAAQAVTISAAALAFLAFNFSPARVFLGDAGSVPLGFLAALLGITGIAKGLWPIWFPFLVFSPFVVDATVTLFKRALRKESLWQAHRDHYYQRLVRMGWGHKRTALVFYAAMFISLIAAMGLRTATSNVQWIALIVIAGAYVFAMRFIDQQWRRFEAGAARHAG